MALNAALRSAALTLCLCASARAGELAVEGRVVDSLGAGLEASVVPVVQLTPLLGSYEGGIRRLERDSAAEPAAETHSDSDGFFFLAAPDYGMWRVVVRAPGFVPMEYLLLPLLGPTVLPNVELSADVGLRVNVIHPLGKAHRDTRVKARPINSVQPTWRASTRTARTDSSGTATLPRGEHEVLSVSAWVAGFPASSGLLAAGPDLELQPRQGIERRVELRRGDKALADVLIWAESWPVALTNLQGSASLAFPVAGKMQVSFESAAGERASDWLANKTLDATEPLIIRLPPASAVLGLVVDRETGAPISGAFVWPSGSPSDFARSDAEGRFQLPAHGESLPLRLAAAGYVGTEDLVQVTAFTSETERTFPLQPAASVSGRVVDEHGGPVPATEIMIRPPPEKDPGRLYRGRPVDTLSRTASRGRFYIDNLAPGTTYRIRAAKEGCAPTELEFTSPEAPGYSTLPDIELGSGQTLEGLVTDDQGAEIVGVDVYLEYSERTSELSTDMWWTTRSGLDGRFEFPHLPSGAFALVAGRVGLGTQLIPSVEVGVGTPAHVSISLEPGKTVVGSVTDPDGFPIRGARLVAASPVVRRFQQHSGWIDVVSDTSGRFAFPDLRSETRFELSVSHPDYLSASVEVDVAVSGSVEIVLDRPLFVAGRVVDPQGEALAHATVRLASTPDRTGSVLERRCDNHGRFAFTHLTPGPAYLYAFADSFLPSGYLPLEITGDTSDIFIELRPKDP